MLVTAFFSIDSLTGNIVYQWTWVELLARSSPSRVYGQIILRTVLMAVAVTVTDAIVALPFAFFLAKVATRRVAPGPLRPHAAAPVGELPRQGLRLDQHPVEQGRPARRSSRSSACRHSHLAYTNVAMWIVFSYLWLPFMIVPIYGAFERVPDSLLEASLGPRGGRVVHLPDGPAADGAARGGGGVDLHLLAHPR